MAGRPKTMARRVTGLHDQAMDLLRSVVKICPKQYQAYPDGSIDRIWLAWNKVFHTALDARVATAELGRILHEKAGLPLPESLQISAESEREWEEAVRAEEEELASGK